MSTATTKTTMSNPQNSPAPVAPKPAGIKKAVEKPQNTVRKTDEKRKADQRAYEKRKKWAREFEENNRSAIMIFRSIGEDNKWYKMGGNSALIYYHSLAKRLKISPRIITDTDFHNKFKDGVISIRSLENFEKKLLSLKIRRNTRYKGDDVVVFPLGYEVGEEEIKAFRKADEAKLKRINAVVMLEVVAPEINVGLLNVTTTLRNKVNKMPVTDREIIGYKAVQRANEALIFYRLMAKGAMDMAKGFTQILHDTDILMCQVSIMAEYKIIDLDADLRLMEQLVNVQKVIRSRLEGTGLEEQMAGAELRRKFGMEKKF